MRRLVPFIGIALVLIAAGIDYAIRGPGASRHQQEVERSLKVLQLPHGSTEADFWSGHQTGHGLASRTVFSTQEQTPFCEELTQSVQRIGWTIAQPCQKAGLNVPMMKFCNGANAGDVYYDGQADKKNKYVVLLGWGLSDNRCEKAGR